MKCIPNQGKFRKTDIPPRHLWRGVQDKTNDIVKKMKFDKEKRILYYNSDIRIENIPLEVDEYIVNGRSALDWLVDQYQVSTDKASGIVNDPNDWAREHDYPRYILDLVLRIIELSVRTVNIVKGLPDLVFWPLLPPLSSLTSCF